jgi:hypothetical protein
MALCQLFSLSLYIYINISGVFLSFEKKRIKLMESKSSRNKQMAKVQGGPTTPMTLHRSKARLNQHPVPPSRWMVCALEMQ